MSISWTAGEKQYATFGWTAKLIIGRKVSGSTLYISLKVLAHLNNKQYATNEAAII